MTRSFVALSLFFFAVASHAGIVSERLVLTRGPVEGIVTRPGHVVAIYSIVAPHAIYGGVERVFINGPHAIRERAAGPRSNPLRKRLARKLRDAKARRQPSTLLKFTSDGAPASETPPALSSDSVEKAAESPVQNSKERAKCGLPSALHNSVGGFSQLLQSLRLSEIRHIRRSRFCAVAQYGLHFPHAS